MTTRAVNNLGHVFNEWREYSGDVRACEVCGGRWVNAEVLRECPGDPPAGTEIRALHCRHCKVEAVILKVEEGADGGRWITWLTNSTTCQTCKERICGKCSTDCPADKGKETGNGN